MSSIDILRSLRPDGTVAVSLRPKGTPTASQLERMAKPAKGLPDEVNDWRSDNWKNNVKQRGLPQIKWAERKGILTMYGALDLTVIRNGLAVPYGLASLRVVTDSGVGFIVDAFQNLTELENMRYHGCGSGTTAEAANQTALITEFTTQYNPDNTRATGTIAESAANIFWTVATNNFDASVAVAEHGVFAQAATGGGAMIDRSQFGAVNLVSGDGLTTDYKLTFTSGG